MADDARAAAATISEAVIACQQHGNALETILTALMYSAASVARVEGSDGAAFVKLAEITWAHLTALVEANAVKP